MTAWPYTALVLVVAGARLVELRVAKQHDVASFAWRCRIRTFHYPFMVVLHAGLLVGCLAEVWLLDLPSWLGWPMMALLVAAHALRWWCIRTLGVQWTTRVIVVPRAGLVSGGITAICGIPTTWLSSSKALRCPSSIPRGSLH